MSRNTCALTGPLQPPTGSKNVSVWFEITLTCSNISTMMGSAGVANNLKDIICETVAASPPVPLMSNFQISLANFKKINEKQRPQETTEVFLHCHDLRCGDALLQRFALAKRSLQFPGRCTFFLCVFDSDFLSLSFPKLHSRPCWRTIFFLHWLKGLSQAIRQKTHWVCIFSDMSVEVDLDACF